MCVWPARVAVGIWSKNVRLRLAREDIGKLCQICAADLPAMRCDGTIFTK